MAQLGILSVIQSASGIATAFIQANQLRQVSVDVLRNSLALVVVAGLAAFWISR